MTRQSHVIQIGDSKRYKVSLGYPRVYTRERWDDDWELDDFLIVDSVEWCANPKIGTATISARYGHGFRTVVDDGFGDVTPRTGDDSLAGRFVKIAIPYTAVIDGEETEETQYWWGVIVDAVDTKDGFYPVGKTTPLASGRQAWTAYDLSWILSRIPITYSLVEGTGNYGGDAWECVRKPLAFNQPTPKAENDDGNMGSLSVAYTGASSDPIHLFSSDLPNSVTSPWSSREIVKYILTVFTGQSTYDIGELATRISFCLEDPGYALTSSDQPYCSTEGKSVKDVLDSVIDRRRLYGYWLSVDEDVTPNKVKVNVFTYTDTFLSLGLGSDGWLINIPSNRSLKSIRCGAAIDVADFSIRSTWGRKYDKVIVLGHPIVCCGTFSYPQNNLWEHWTADEKSAYRTAASTTAAYTTAKAAGELAVCEDMNTLARKSDSLRRVYSWFGLSRLWNGECDTPVFGVGSNPLFPPLSVLRIFHQLASTPVFSPWYWPELRFLPHLPILDVDSTPDSNRPEYRPMLVMMNFLFSLSSGSPSYRMVDVTKLGALRKTEQTYGLDQRFECSVAAQAEAPGFILTINGEPQHIIAKDDWFPIDDSEEAILGGIVYSSAATALSCTAAMESAYRAEVSYPDDGSLEIDNWQDFRNVLIIDYTTGSRGKDRGRIWWIAPNTITDIAADGTVVKEVNGRFAKDERDPMRAVAKLMYNWFSRERRSVSLTIKQPFFDFVVGDYIQDSIHGYTESETVGSVVTSVSIELSNMPQTTVHTEFAELDAMAYL